MTTAAGRRMVLVASAMGSSLAPFLVSGLIVALPAIGDEFSAGTVLLGWVTNAFFLAAAVFLVPFGRIADIYGVKKVFLTGIIVYLVSVVLCAASTTVQLLIASRFLTGVGAGMVFGTSIALLSLVFPESELGRAIGINVTAMFIGFLAGFFFGGLLTFYLDWRLLFIATIPVELAVIGLILLRIRGECELPAHRRLDIPGILLYSATIFLLMVGLSSLPSYSGAAEIAAGCIALIFFIVRELRTESPMLDVRLFMTNRTFSTAHLTALLFNSANFAIVFILSLYLQDIQGIDARAAGIVLLIPVAVMALFSTFAGKLADKVDPRIVIRSGIGMLAVGLAFFSQIGPQTPFPFILTGLVLFGSGLAFFQSPLVRTLVRSVPRQIYGLASGLIETMRLMGMMISIAITIVVFTVMIGNVHITPAVSDLFLPAMKTVFWLFFVLSLAALGVSFLLPRQYPGGKISS